MVEIADIRDKESFEKWLEDKPSELAVLLAHRAAARVMPLYWAWAADPSSFGDLEDIRVWRILPTTQVITSDDARLFQEIAIATANNSLSSNIAFNIERARTHTISRALDSAQASVLAVNSSADTAAQYVLSREVAMAASHSADAAERGANDLNIWAEIRHDVASYQGTNMRAPLSLWKDGTPLEISEAWQTTRTALAERIEAGDTGWQFWIDWYEAQLSGADQNWEMLKQIVLIPDEDWKQGAVHVNAMIAEIVASYHGDAKIPQASKVELGDDTEIRSDIAAAPSLRQSLDRNAKSIGLQLDTLATFLREEIETLRGRNDLNDQEREDSQRRIDILSRLLVRVETMAWEFEDDKASENALTVIEQNLPALAEDAGELVEEGSDPEVSELVISMGASIEHLTKRGTPGTLATGIAAFDHLWGGLRSWWANKKGGTP